MQEAAERTFSPPPCFSLLPFHLFPSTLQGHCWPSHCGPACTLLWFCLSVIPAGYLSQGTPGILRLCFTCTHFPCCTQERVSYGTHSSIECLSSSLPRTHVLVTATFSSVALQKIILTHLFSFKTLPWRSFLHLVALTTSHFHVFLLWLPLFHTSRINTVLFALGFFRGLTPTWTSPLLLPRCTSSLPWHLSPWICIFENQTNMFSLTLACREETHSLLEDSLWSFPKPFPLLQCQR